MKEFITPPHPGTVLERDLRTRSIPVESFAEKLGVDQGFLNKLIEGKQDIDVYLSAAINDQFDGSTPTHLYQLQQDHNRWKKIYLSFAEWAGDNKETAV